MNELKHFFQLRGVVSGLAALALLALLTYMAAPVLRENAAIQTAQTAQTAAMQTENTQKDALERFRTERAQMRKEEMDQLNQLIESEETDDQIALDAQRQLLDLCAWMEQETTIEGVLRARGFADPLVTVHGDSVNILVRASMLSQEESARILELVLRETGQTGGNVKIIPVE